MEIDVGAYIADLLFEHDSVTIPGLGGFVSQYRPATIDQVQGKLHPPAKDLNFNDNLTVNDGILINLIKEKHGLAYAEAERTVAEYAQQVKSAIDRREIVIFPRVGRLYKDFKKQLQFLPDNTNFNTDSFGLPGISFHPVAIVRQTDPETPPVSGPAPVKREKAISAAIADLFQRFLPLIGAVSVVVVALGIYFILQDRNQKTAATGEESKQIPTSRINIKPSAGEADDAPALPDDPEDIADLEEESNDAGSIDTESITTPAEQHFVIIAIGLFSDKENINRLVEKIYKAGYEPYLEDVGKVTRIGVQRSYQRSAEIQEILEDVQRQFNKDAFVFKLS